MIGIAIGELLILLFYITRKSSIAARTRICRRKIAASRQQFKEASMSKGK
jgi:hypothetical protein